MVNKLKELIFFKAGREIVNRGDCEYLSRMIEIETGEYLNYNTLRRFFAIDKQACKPRIATLDILSKYIGYQSFDHFMSFKPQKILYDHGLKMFSSLNEFTPENLSTHFNSLGPNYNLRLYYIIEVCRFGLLTKQIDQLCEALDLMDMPKNYISFDEMTIVGNSVGVLFRKLQLSKKDWKTLYNNAFFNEYIFEIFVDYASLNGHYLGFIKNQSATSEEQRYFKRALYTLHQYLNNRTNLQKPVFNFSTKSKNMHPVLQGRMLSIHLYDNTATKDMLTLIENPMLDHFYEPMTASILTSNLIWFDFIDQQMEPMLKDTSLRSAHYFDVYFLLKAVYAYKSKKHNQAVKLLKEINPENFRLSYKEIMNFFYLLLDYKISGNEQSKEQALTLSETMNYPRYNLAFVEEY